MRKDITQPMVFVLMPFDVRLKNTFYAIEQAASKLGVKIERADDPPTSDTIIRRIYQGIETADLVLADLTDKNTNVFYEVGFAHAIGKPVAFLAPSVEYVPFDLRAYPIGIYSVETSVQDLVDSFRTYLGNALRGAKNTSMLRLPLEKALIQLVGFDNSSTLFSSLLARRLYDLNRDVSQWVQGSMKVSPEETREKGIAVLKSLRKGGFATLLVPVQTYWATGTDYLKAAREAARDGKEITRVFVLFEEVSIENPSLRECISLDSQAGIATFVCFAKKVVDKEAIRDFGIWDDEVLCLVDVTSTSSETQVTGAQFTVNSAEIGRALRWKENILAGSEKAEMVLRKYSAIQQIQQPVVSTANLMHKLAENNCKGGYIDRSDCSWYHRSWQFLRILDLVSTPDWHAAFYAQTFSSISAASVPKRALICGTADYGLLAHLHAALATKGWEIFVLDLCDTPLEMCKWFADQKNFQIRVLKGDALELDFRDGWFGLITSDAFLTRFEQNERRTIVSEWNRCLAPGGSIVTTIRTESNITMIRASEMEATDFVARAEAAALKLGSMLPCPLGQLREMATQYATHIISYPVSTDELDALFMLFVSSIELTTSRGEFRTTSYARVRASKPIGARTVDGTWGFRP